MDSKASKLSADILKLYAICIDQDNRIKELTDKINSLNNNIIKIQLEKRNVGVVHRPAQISIKSPGLLPDEVKTILDKQNDIPENTLDGITQFL